MKKEIKENLEKIKESPASFWDLYKFKFKLLSQDYPHEVYPKQYVAEGDNIAKKCIAKEINYLFYPDNDGEVNLDTLLEARFTPRKPTFQYKSSNDFGLPTLTKRSASETQTFEVETIELKTIRFSYKLTPIEYNDEKVFDFMGIEIWKTNWEIPYKEEQVDKFKNDIKDKVERWAE